MAGENRFAFGCGEKILSPGGTFDSKGRRLEPEDLVEGERRRSQNPELFLAVLSLPVTKGIGSA